MINRNYAIWAMFSLSALVLGPVNVAATNEKDFSQLIAAFKKAGEARLQAAEARFPQGSGELKLKFSQGAPYAMDPKTFIKGVLEEKMRLKEEQRKEAEKREQEEKDRIRQMAAALKAVQSEKKQKQEEKMKRELLERQKEIAKKGKKMEEIMAQRQQTMLLRQQQEVMLAKLNEQKERERQAMASQAQNAVVMGAAQGALAPKVSTVNTQALNKKQVEFEKKFEELRNAIKIQLEMKKASQEQKAEQERIRQEKEWKEQEAANERARQEQQKEEMRRMLDRHVRGVKQALQSDDETGSLSQELLAQQQKLALEEARYEEQMAIQNRQLQSSMMNVGPVNPYVGTPSFIPMQAPVYPVPMPTLMPSNDIPSYNPAPWKSAPAAFSPAPSVNTITPPAPQAVQSPIIQTPTAYETSIPQEEPPYSGQNPEEIHDQQQDEQSDYQDDYTQEGYEDGDGDY